MILNSKTLLPKTIYLADDDEDDCTFFAEALNEIHAEAAFTICRNGEELMNLLDKQQQPQPDIIFLDLNMPLKNGYECLKEIRNNTAFKNAPVVIFTTSGLEEDINIVYGLGATHFATKPTSFDKLKALIFKVINMPWQQGLMQPEREKFVLSI
ncbi:MAG: response regulator [Bacteroidota bacterium]